MWRRRWTGAGADAMCSLRSSGELYPSPSGEISYVPTAECYTCQGWIQHPGQFQSGSAGDAGVSFTLEDAKLACLETQDCTAVVCSSGENESLCTLRNSGSLYEGTLQDTNLSGYRRCKTSVRFSPAPPPAPTPAPAFRDSKVTVIRHFKMTSFRHPKSRLFERP